MAFSLSAACFAESERTKCVGAGDGGVVPGGVARWPGDSMRTRHVATSFPISFLNPLSFSPFYFSLWLARWLAPTKNDSPTTTTHVCFNSIALSYRRAQSIQGKCPSSQMGLDVRLLALRAIGFMLERAKRTGFMANVTKAAGNIGACRAQTRNRSLCAHLATAHSPFPSLL